MNANQYRFVSNNGLDVTMLRDEAAPYLNGGYGGWSVQTRLRKVGLTYFTGPDPIRLVVPVLFDGWADQLSQEVAISTLERMARPALDGGEPPAIQIFGGIPRKDIPAWLIESIDQSQQQKVIWGVSGGVPVRFRQDLIVNFIEQITEDRIAMSSLPGVGFGPGGAPGARPHPRHAFHTVMAGETLAKISQLEYGSPKYVSDILAANGMRDPKAIKPKQKLRMP